MAHFAQLDDNNVVISVYVLDNETILDGDAESEAKGIAILSSIFNHTRWKQTSYNKKFRKYYAGIGYTYSEADDVFIPPSPNPSWVLNRTKFEWEPPFPRPDDNGTGNPVIYYEWNEATVSWIRFVPANATPIVTIGE